MKNKKGFWQGALCGALAVILITGFVSCGKVKSVVSDDTEKKLGNIKRLVEYYFLDEYDEKELETGLLEGYVSGLDDPYSVYYDEKDTAALMESVQGEYSGIGAVLSQDAETGVITMIRIYEDSPAMKAGLKDGDVLYKIEDIEVTGEACPIWVPLVETNEYNSDGADYFVKRHVENLLKRDSLIDTIILGCTHYPILIDKIRKYTPENVKLITQGAAVASSLKKYLENHPEMERLCTKGGTTVFCTTESDGKFGDQASLFLNQPIDVKTVALGDD